MAVMGTPHTNWHPAPREGEMQNQTSEKAGAAQ